MKICTKLSLLIVILSISLSAQAQKKPIDHSVYDTWESIGGVTVPYNGKFLTYLVNTQESDRTMVLYDIQTGEKIEINRGISSAINRDGDRMVFRISPFYKDTRDAKIKKAKPIDMPKDTLAVMNLTSKEIKKYPYVSSYKYGKEFQEYIAFQEADKPTPKDAPKPDKNAPKVDKEAGKPLFILNSKTFAVDTIKFVEKYSVRNDGKEIFYITKPGKKDSVTLKALYRYNPATKESKLVLSVDKKAKIELPFYNKDYTKYHFLAQSDTTKNALKYLDIYQYLPKDNEVTKIVTKETKGIPEGYMISEKAPINYTDDGRMINFSIKRIPPQKDTITPDFEKVKVDVWRWNADYLPTMSQGRDDAIYNKNYITAYYFNNPDKVVRLSDDDAMFYRIKEEFTADYIIATSDKPYRISSQWEGEVPRDVYKVSLLTGEKQLIKKEIRCGGFSASPSGSFYVYYDYIDQNWFIYDITSDSFRNLTQEIGYPFWDEETDTPSYPSPYTGVTWFEDDKAFIIGDQYDIWYFDPTGAVAPKNLTEGQGRKTNTQFRINRPLNDPLQSRSMMGGIIDPLKNTEPLFFSTFDRTTKEKGMYILDRNKKRAKLTLIAQGPFNYNLSGVSLSNEYPGISDVAKNGKGTKAQRPPRKLSVPVFVYTKGNFENSTNVFVTKDFARTEQKISNTNPQQSEYNWGTVELVNWMTDDSIRAEGLLFKPEDFDSTKKYPVMIYFYEKYSNDLYNYRAPAPSRSTVNIPYFVSNGYIVFIPDIYYTVGHPGKSAMRSIMPGVDMLCKNSWIDQENMAIQGQSWGGYQVAYMITQTDRFKAAGAGAPVSNMTSAYGGIRWGSGLTRQFQYEHGQSRIGKDLWSGFDLYVENSPLFFVEKVKTPVLIMHNDQDDAVPWYQGIEFFVGLKRQGKEAYMIQYIGETHNLKNRYNAKDLSKKLAEFFGYYLKGEPMPEWMKVK